jgi:hypothetical protein
MNGIAANKMNPAPNARARYVTLDGFSMIGSVTT